MKIAHLAASASALALAIGAPAAAQSKIETASGGQSSAASKAVKDDQTDTGDQSGDIIVVGIRGSVEKAVAIKKKAKQIVEAVVAEDISKLPDNNVTEAISRLTGVQIDRSHGEGGNVSIRGLGGVQTTINGQDVANGADRSVSLSDIPAELVKSVTVYKTRTADQIEGGVAGTVNVDLRRPLDFERNKWVVAGSYRAKFGDGDSTYSPYWSALIGKRFDTAAGEMGFLLNGAYSINSYAENAAAGEGVGNFFGDAQAALPSALRDTIFAPFRAYYTVQRGKTKRPSLNAAFQWRPSGNLDLILETSYFRTDGFNKSDGLWATLREANSCLVSYTSIDGKETQLITSATYTGCKGTRPSAGVNGSFGRSTSWNWTHNFEAHYNREHLTGEFEASYNVSAGRSYDTFQNLSLRNLKSVQVDFRGTGFEAGAPMVSFPDIDLRDPNNYLEATFTDRLATERSRYFSARGRLQYEVSTKDFIRSLEVGARYSSRPVFRQYGYRDAFPFSSVLMTAFPFSETIAERGPVSSDVRWLSADTEAMYNGIDKIRQFIVDNPKIYGAGGSGVWNKPLPDGDNSGTYKATERSLAVFGNVYYGFDVYKVPVTGVLGVRGVRTYGSTSATTTVLDRNWNKTDTVQSARGDYWDWMPSLNLSAQLTSKLTLRGVWNKNISRAGFSDLTAWRIVQFANGVVYSGNPGLKPVKTTDINVELSYSLPNNGFASLGFFRKAQEGFLFYRCLNGIDGADLGGLPPPNNGSTWTECKLRNAGPGRFAGFEGQVQKFFDFLPGPLKKFGVQANATLQTQYRLLYPNWEEFADIADNRDLTQADGVSRWTFNSSLLYDNKVLSGRLSYNWRGPFRTSYNGDAPQYSTYWKATSTLDAALNWTPVKFATLSVEGINLLENANRGYYGHDYLMTSSTRLRPRYIQASLRMRY